VEVVTEGNRLIIRGQRPSYSAEKRQRAYHQMEIPAGPFERVIELPLTADTDGANASYHNGFLEIVVPQRAVSAERTVRIQTRS
jgi:HSP20 family protein